MIIRNYLFKKIITTQIIFFSYLTILIIVITSVRIFKSDINSVITINDIIIFIGLLVPFYLTYLIPVSAILGTAFSTSKSYYNEELQSMFICGMTWKEYFKVIIPIAIIFSIFSGIISTFISPKVNYYRYLISNNPSFKRKISLIPDKQFIFIKNKLIYVNEKDNNLLKNIFISFLQDESNTSITASKAYQYLVPSLGINYLILKNSQQITYSINDNEIITSKFGQIELNLSQLIPMNTNNVKTYSFKKLISKPYNPVYEAELQFRLSFFFTTFICVMISSLIFTVGSNKKLYLKLILAVILFLTYFQLLDTFKHLIEKGKIPIYIGILPLHLIFLGIFFILFKKVKY